MSIIIELLPIIVKPIQRIKKNFNLALLLLLIVFIAICWWIKANYWIVTIFVLAYISVALIYLDYKEEKPINEYEVNSLFSDFVYSERVTYQEIVIKKQKLIRIEHEENYFEIIFTEKPVQLKINGEIIRNSEIWHPKILVGLIFHVLIIDSNDIPFNLTIKLGGLFNPYVQLKIISVTPPKNKNT